MRVMAPARATLLLGLTLPGCVVSWGDLGESLLVAALPVALLGAGALALLDRLWGALLPPHPSPKRAAVVAVVLGALATVAGTVTLLSHAAHERARLAAPRDGSTFGGWFSSLHLGVMLFSSGVLALALLVWRALARRRPAAAMWAALHGVLGTWWIFGLVALSLGRRRPIPDLLFVVIYWGGSMGIVPAVILALLAVEALLRRRAAARAGETPKELP